MDVAPHPGRLEPSTLWRLRSSCCHHFLHSTCAGFGLQTASGAPGSATAGTCRALLASCPAVRLGWAVAAGPPASLAGLLSLTADRFSLPAGRGGKCSRPNWPNLGSCASSKVCSRRRAATGGTAGVVHEVPVLPVLTILRCRSRAVALRPAFWRRWLAARAVPQGRPPGAARQVHRSIVLGTKGAVECSYAAASRQGALRRVPPAKEAANTQLLRLAPESALTQHSEA